MTFLSSILGFQIHALSKWEEKSDHGYHIIIYEVTNYNYHWWTYIILLYTDEDLHILSSGLAKVRSYKVMARLLQVCFISCKGIILILDNDMYHLRALWMNCLPLSAVGINPERGCMCCSDLILCLWIINMTNYWQFLLIHLHIIFGQ